MSEFQLNTPVVLIIFNRPDTTKKVFSEIAKAKPPKLLIIADGPRSDRIGEVERCLVTRAIIGNVDWPCEVLTNYSEVNLGCKYRVSSGLDWVFEQVPEAIILEDDCLPEPSFFRFCEELLIRYRDDESVAMISGANFQFGKNYGNSSYYFSRYNHIWGWASWRRAWKRYDVEAKDWAEFRSEKWLNSLFFNTYEQKYWVNIFQSVAVGKIDTWDYQWTMAAWKHQMVSIIPNTNLISNIGFGVDATHTFGSNIFDRVPVGAMSFPLRHAKSNIADKTADLYTEKIMFSGAQGGYFRQFGKYLIKMIIPKSWINYWRSKQFSKSIAARNV
jgi:hypothetical protein